MADLSSLPTGWEYNPAAIVVGKRQRSLDSPPPLPEMPGMEFRACPGYFGYCVSNTGVLMGCRRPGPQGYFSREWRLINAKPGVKPYIKASLFDGERRVTRNVHVLVLEAFAGPRPNGMVCRHLNGNPTDNRIENLAWGTESENQRDAVRHGTSPGLQRFADNHYFAKFSREDVATIRSLAAEGVNLGELASLYGTTRDYVQKIVTGKKRRRG